VKFTLTYDGQLPPSANKSKKDEVWDIRNRFDPQLRDLWANHPALSMAEQDGRNDPTGFGAMLAPIEKHGAWFRPLVRESFALHCGLKVLFLRKEAPGKVYQGGDLDGRIKTLLDALTMPQHKEQIISKIGSDTDALQCLLEDDSMVSGLQVESERLLTDQQHPADFVRLVIEVDVRVRNAMIFNQFFLS
jgi:hypothetical protein